MKRDASKSKWGASKSVLDASKMVWGASKSKWGATKSVLDVTKTVWVVTKMLWGAPLLIRAATKTVRGASLLTGIAPLLTGATAPAAGDGSHDEGGRIHPTQGATSRAAGDGPHWIFRGACKTRPRFYSNRHGQDLPPNTARLKTSRLYMILRRTAKIRQGLAKEPCIVNKFSCRKTLV